MKSSRSCECLSYILKSNVKSLTDFKRSALRRPRLFQDLRCCLHEKSARWRRLCNRQKTSRQAFTICIIRRCCERAEERKKKTRAPLKVKPKSELGFFQLSPYRRAVSCWCKAIRCYVTLHTWAQSTFLCFAFLSSALKTCFFFLFLSFAVPFTYRYTYLPHFSISVQFITVIRFDSIMIMLCVARTFRIHRWLCFLFLARSLFLRATID